MGIFGKPKSGAALVVLPNKRQARDERLDPVFRTHIGPCGIRGTRHAPVRASYTFVPSVYVNTRAAFSRSDRASLDPPRSRWRMLAAATRKDVANGSR